MIRGITYTKRMDNKLKSYQKKNFLSLKELMIKCGMSESSIYSFRKRKKISISGIKKIKEILGIDLLIK